MKKTIWTMSIKRVLTLLFLSFLLTSCGSDEKNETGGATSTTPVTSDSENLGTVGANFSIGQLESFFSRKSMEEGIKVGDFFTTNSGWSGSIEWDIYSEGPSSIVVQDHDYGDSYTINKSTIMDVIFSPRSVLDIDSHDRVDTQIYPTKVCVREGYVPGLGNQSQSSLQEFNAYWVVHTIQTQDNWGPISWGGSQQVSMLVAPDLPLVVNPIRLDSNGLIDESTMEDRVVTRVNWKDIYECQ